MSIEFRKRCLDYAIAQCRQDAIVNMTDDEIIAEWGLQRSPSGPLHASSERIAALVAERDRYKSALEVISGKSSRACPFSGGARPDLKPEDPCPVCGDKGDFSDKTLSKASACVGNAPSAIARAALAQGGEP